MELKRRKRLTTLVLVVLVISSLTAFGASESFHSYNNGFQTRSMGNNVSAVIIMKLGYLSVNAVVTVISTQLSTVTVHFMNGTSVQVNNYYLIHIHLNKTARYDNQQSFTAFSNGLNLSLTSSQPIAVGIFENTQIPNPNSMQESGNSYTFYVSGYSDIQISAVGEAI